MTHVLELLSLHELLEHGDRELDNAHCQQRHSRGGLAEETHSTWDIF